MKRRNFGVPILSAGTSRYARKNATRIMVGLGRLLREVSLSMVDKTHTSFLTESLYGCGVASSVKESNE